jgi:Na+/melibiose symporter-like transporter
MRQLDATGNGPKTVSIAFAILLVATLVTYPFSGSFIGKAPAYAIMLVMIIFLWAILYMVLKKSREVKQKEGNNGAPQQTT